MPICDLGDRRLVVVESSGHCTRCGSRSARGAAATGPAAAAGAQPQLALFEAAGYREVAISIRQAQRTSLRQYPNRTVPVRRRLNADRARMG